MQAMAILPLVLSALVWVEVKTAGSGGSGGSGGGESCITRCPGVDERQWPPEEFVEDELAVRCSLWCSDMTIEEVRNVHNAQWKCTMEMHNGNTKN